jgi:hypothetical protein
MRRTTWPSTSTFISMSLLMSPTFGDDGANQTVFDDGARDSLTGSQGVDWFFSNLDTGVKDVITDKASGETSNDIDL